VRMTKGPEPSCLTEFSRDDGESANDIYGDKRYIAFTLDTLGEPRGGDFVFRPSCGEMIARARLCARPSSTDKLVNGKGRG
jgi:hypothetical protein